jgi:hypothetical protein
MKSKRQILEELYNNGIIHRNRGGGITTEYVETALKQLNDLFDEDEVRDICILHSNHPYDCTKALKEYWEKK